MDQHDTNDERPWLQWDQGHPYSKRYGDRYFDRDGLAESDYVFLRHNDLPARWANRRAFTIGELGFGTGLNACLTLERWRQTAHPDACLDYISVESHPLGADDMRRALAQWPQLGRTADALASACQRLQPGFNLRVLESGRVRLLVLCGDVDRMLEALDAQVDAWYLDGFAPARNPDMWSETVCRLLAARTRSGGSFATYTAAGWVRRNLQAAGYDVCKAPGFGRKRDMLHGHLAKAVDAPAQADAAAKPWFQRPKPAATDHAVVIGAGLAGSATARALAERGLDVTVYDRPKPDMAPPSRLPALIVRPYPERAANLRGRFYDAAFGHAAHRLKQAAGWHPTGVGVIAHRGRLSGQVLDAAGLTQAVGTALQAPGQWLPNAGWLHPTRWTAAWLDHPRIRCLNQPAPDRLAGLPTVLATGAAVTSALMATAVDKEIDDVKDNGTTTCASGCELSLAAGVMSMAAAAVFPLRKYASAPAGDDPATTRRRKKLGGCCEGDPKNHGCCAVPNGPNDGRAAQVMSILGLILALICLIVNFVYWTWFWALVLLRHLDLPAAGIGIYIQLLCLLLSIIAYSRGLCCVTGERGWNCTAGFLRVLSVLYVVAIVCIATSHSNIDTAIDKECEEDDDDCDWVSAWLDRVFYLLYASAALNLAFTAVTAYLLNHAAPDWVERDAGEDDDTKPVSEGDIDLCGRKVTVEQRFRRMTAFGCLCVVCQLVAALGLGHWAHIELEYDLWRRKLQSSRCDSSWTFEPVSSWYCPYSPSSLPDCDSSSTACGAMCEADGECGTSTSLDNCGYGYDVYTKYCSTSTSYDDDLWRSFDGDLTIYLSYDLWKSYYRNDEDDDDTDEEKLYGSKCKDDDFCEDVVSATDVARITTLLALLLTVVGVFGLWRYRRSPDAEARAKRFERCCGLLAVGGFAGLVGASNYSSKMTTAVKDNLDTSINDLDTCAAGCALSLSFGLIATVVGAAAVFLQRKYAIGEAPAEAPSAPLAEEEA